MVNLCKFKTVYPEFAGVKLLLFTLILYICADNIHVFFLGIHIYLLFYRLVLQHIYPVNYLK